MRNLTEKEKKEYENMVRGARQLSLSDIVKSQKETSDEKTSWDDKDHEERERGGK